MNIPTHDAKAVFFEALEMATPEELAAYLDRTCGEDRQLRGRVAELLEAHNKAGRFLEGSATTADTIDLPPSIPKFGTQIGRYKLLKKIGEGGMGMVWLAEQSKPVRRKVALKIIKPGMDSRQVIARFEAERQTLALMDHPNIARVLDAGQTDSGSPYFVMELVRGTPVTEFCDKRHLSPRDRLQLFKTICLAVQHAHQKGVIHRDIKPGNILVAQVDGQPVPKVIDFGIAKATNQTLTDKSLFTQLGQIVGTLEYMSPEQANACQLDVDTRSDIYSLGVLLYELLTGQTPFDRQRLKAAALEDILRMIREEEPPKPSTRLNDCDTLPAIAANRHVEPKQLAVVVQGELDWIVMKAIEKDRLRRYQTAADFATDVRRYLDDEPILARPVSRNERAMRWLRRNPIIAVATSVSILAIAIGVTIAFVSLSASRNAALNLAAEKTRIAKRERAANAESQAALVQVEAARQTEAAERKKADIARREQEQAAAEAKAVSNFLVKSLISAVAPEQNLGRQLTVRQMLDQSALSIGEAFPRQPRTEAAIRVAIGRAYSSLGLYEDSFRQLTKAHAVQQKLLGEDHPETLATAFQLKTALHALGRIGDEQELEKKTLAAMIQKYGDRDPKVLSLKSRMAVNLDVQGKYEQSEQLFEEVLQQQKEVLGPEHESTLATLANLALNRMHMGKLKDGEQMLLKMIEVFQRKHGTEDRDVMHAKRYLAMNLGRQNRLDEAEDILRQVLETSQRITGQEHPETLKAQGEVALILNAQGRHEEAALIFGELVETFRRVLGPRHTDTLTTAYNAGMVLLKCGDHAAAESALKAIMADADDVLGPSHSTTLAIYRDLAISLHEQKKFTEYEALLTQMVKTRETALGPHHATTLVTMIACAEQRLLLGMQDQAKPLAERAVKGCIKEFGLEDGRTMIARTTLANVNSDLGEYAAATRTFIELIEQYKRQPPTDKSAVQFLVVTYNLGKALVRQEKVAEAIEVYSNLKRRLQRRLPDDHAAVSELTEVITQLRDGTADLKTLEPGAPLMKEIGAYRTVNGKPATR